MKHKVNIDKDGRVLSIGKTRDPNGKNIVKNIPNEKVTDYFFIDGEFIHSPKAKTPVPYSPTAHEKLIELEKRIVELEKKCST